MSRPNNFNQAIIEEFRANGGKVSGQFAGAPLLLLNTVGAKSKQPRTNPVAYTKDGDTYLIIASKAGAPVNPDWYYNVVANPDVTIEVGQSVFGRVQPFPKGRSVTVCSLRWQHRCQALPNTSAIPRDAYPSLC